MEMVTDKLKININILFIHLGRKILLKAKKNLTTFIGAD